MSKWFRRIAVPVVLLAMVAAACSKSNTPTASNSSAGPKCPSDFKVGLALDIGGLGDQSFNDAANRGLQKAISEGLVCRGNVKLVPSNAAGSNLDDNTQALASAGYNYVEGVGFSFSAGIAKIAGLFPGTDFGVIDGFATTLPGGKNAANLTDLTFKEQEGSYLVGIAAAMQAKEDGSTTVGFLGGQTGPLIGKFQAGYTAGVQSVDPGIKVLVEYIGDTTQAFVNPTAGKAKSEKMYNEGADVVYHAAGLSGAGLFQAAAEKAKWAIGVDSDQYLTASADQQPFILTSMLKRVDTATYNAIKQSGSGTFKSGFQVFDLAADGVDYSKSNSALTSAMIAAMDAAKAKIISGEIKVPDTPTT
jgi:basic membrane protein A